MPAQLQTCRGFTLIELLVALVILAVMTALGYGTYRTGRMSVQRTETSLQRSREIEFGMRVMAQDFAECAPRPVRQTVGDGLLAAFRGTNGAGKVSVTPQSLGANNLTGAGTSLLSSSSSNFSTTGVGTSSTGSSFGGGSSFGTTQVTSMVDLTRTSWSNTAGQQRGTLQRVSYALVGDVLKRSYQVNLDTVLANKPVVQDLITGVKGVQFRYLDSNQAWQNNWPSTAGNTDPLQARPVAVEIVIEFNDWGPIRRLIEIPS
jgi:prepilin-type N-terminal cleavage/methylation domain-containing protein